jgi:hypothetical protein
MAINTAPENVSSAARFSNSDFTAAMASASEGLACAPGPTINAETTANESKIDRHDAIRVFFPRAEWLPQ